VDTADKQTDSHTDRSA